MALVMLKRPFWGPDGKFYEPAVTGTEIPIEGWEKTYGEAYPEDKERKRTGVNRFLPADARVMEKGEKATLLPETHPTVSTLSEMSKIPAVDAVTASKGPTAIVSDEAMAGEPEAQTKPTPAKK